MRNFINEPYVQAYITLIWKFLSVCCTEKHCNYNTSPIGQILQWEDMISFTPDRYHT